MLCRVKEYVKQNKMLHKCDRIVVGLSGGADSVCLLLVLSQLCQDNCSLVAVHVNHGIRGAEADKDQEFCRNLCEKLGVEFEVYSYDVPQYAKEKHLTVEEAGRLLRYEAFNENAGNSGKIAVAHHKNDQAETVLFNLCRGSGLKGACGMTPVRDNVIRPLLCVSRDEIEEYLREQKISWCEDSTNEDNGYTRNCIRNLIIPAMQENINEKAVDNLAGFARMVYEAENYLEELTKTKFQELVSYRNKQILLKRIDTLDTYMAGRLVRMAICQMNRGLKDIGFVHVENILALLDSGVGALCDVKAGIKVEHTREGLLFYKEEDLVCGEPMDIKVPSKVEPWEGAGTFEFSFYEAEGHKKFSNEVYTKYFDYDKIKFGLQLRGWKQGDVIAIDDEGHHKKIKQYFVDEKKSGIDKVETILLADGSNIVWIVGGRIGADYKITDSTKRILKVTYGGRI